MKRRILALVLALLALTGCKNAENSNLSSADQALLDQMVGMDAFDKMKQDQQEQLLEDLGIGRYTLEDVAGQGRYMVVLSDTLGLNTFTLHYEDGILARVATSFRKSAKDTPLESAVSGLQLEDYHYKAIHFLSYTPQDLATLLAEEGYAQVSVSLVSLSP